MSGTAVTQNREYHNASNDTGCEVQKTDREGLVMFN